MSYEFGPASIFMKPEDAKKDGWVSLGQVEAMIITTANGTKLRSGKREVLFDMEQTEADKELLKGMMIGVNP